jgi:lipoate-protein ligase A
MGERVSTWRLLGDQGASAAGGLALDEALMLHYARGARPPAEAVLRLYTYAPHCALVGRYQHLDAEVDRAACSRLGVQVGRRATGGGAIIMGPGQLGVAIATRAPAAASPRELLARYAQGILAGLGSLGLKASFRGKNDLEVEGRKIAGLGLYVDQAGALLFHASVLAELDVGLMLEVLRIPSAKHAQRAIAHVAERVTTVSRQTGVRLDGQQLAQPIADGIASALGVRLARCEPDAHERARAAELERERYGAAAWIEGPGEPAGARGTATLRTPEGLVRVYVGVQRGALSAVMLTGDFNAPPPGLLELEAALRWCRADPRRISQVASATLRARELGVGPEKIAAAIWSAAERALCRLGAAPVRAAGSCYFPEPGQARAADDDKAREVAA